MGHGYVNGKHFDLTDVGNSLTIPYKNWTPRLTGEN
jgi:hypothetical protein